MEGPGRDAGCVLPDGRTLDYWEGGDPDGRAVLHHPGTPCTRVFGPMSHEAALELGVRLVSISRPGYGGSTLPDGAASLLATGRDTAELARLLGMEEYAVMGTSGGGPFAAATAVADPDRVRGVAIVAGGGPWRELTPPDPDDEADTRERAVLALLDVGDVDGARERFLAMVTEELSGLVGLGDEARVDAFFGGHGPTDPYRRSLWAANLAEVVERPDGYVLDNLAWGGPWDIDPSLVTAPTTLWYGDADFLAPVAHGEWYAARIAGAELVVLPGDGHMEVCSDHATEQLAALLDRWGGPSLGSPGFEARP